MPSVHDRRDSRSIAHLPVKVIAVFTGGDLDLMQRFCLLMMILLLLDKAQRDHATIEFTIDVGIANYP